MYLYNPRLGSRARWQKRGVFDVLAFAEASLEKEDELDECAYAEDYYSNAKHESGENQG